MKKILVLGAGRSASSLIDKLLEDAVTYDWQVKIGDLDLDLAKSKIAGHSNGEAITFNISDDKLADVAIADADLVISMLPPALHIQVALICVKYGRDMVTASYVSEDIAQLGTAVEKAGSRIVMECGVDPGIDHMSAIRVIDNIKAEGGKLTAFRSYTGGLVAPESDDNPWNYKITWNPRNVVLAGKGTAKYIRNGLYKFIPYQRLFQRLDTIKVPGYGEFDGYMNRDSLSYREVYDLQDIPTMIRGTLRRPGFCKAWDVFVQLGMTDDSFTLPHPEELTWRDFINLFLVYKPDISVEAKLADYLGLEPEGEVIQQLRWLGIFDNSPLGLKSPATPADALQKLIVDKLRLKEGDKDMIVMHHEFDFVLDGLKKRISSSMVCKGRDETHTAMSMTVGYPMAIVARLLLQGKISQTGVLRPISKEIYEPALVELENMGIIFNELEESI